MRDLETVVLVGLLAIVAWKILIEGQTVGLRSPLVWGSGTDDYRLSTPSGSSVSGPSGCGCGG